MADMEPFTLVERTARPGPHHLFDDMARLSGGKTADHDVQYVVALREANPGMIVTCIPIYNVSLTDFAAAGYARCELDTETDSFESWKGYVAPRKRSQDGQLAETIYFAKYRYIWNDEGFILYTVGGVQYVLKECRDGEHVLGSSRITDTLIKTIGNWYASINNVVWVYDLYWTQSQSLWEEVQKTSWDDVILDESMKKELTAVTNKFFSSKEIYEDLGVPWKRGLLFHGPPGNGKTISIRALMHGLYDRDDPIPTLYVKSAPMTWDISSVFSHARALAPCMLILEDIETIVTPETRSYFFNEMDGLENNDGIFIVASTNFLDRLDPGLSNRPSRFDRKYKFALPNEGERTQYCEYWRNKLKPKKSIEFPEKLCPAMAHITPGFSFAYLQECFVATLLVLARDEIEQQLYTRDARPFDDDNDDLDDYKLWVTFKEQADILRKDMDSQKHKNSQPAHWLKLEGSAEEATASTSRNQGGHRHHCCHRSEQASSKGAKLGLRSKGEMLPELPWYYTKMEYINSAAMELRL